MLADATPAPASSGGGQAGAGLGGTGGCPTSVHCCHLRADVSDALITLPSFLLCVTCRALAWWLMTR